MTGSLIAQTLLWGMQVIVHWIQYELTAAEKHAWLNHSTT
jgi:hypothetical protein